jgi:raffinose/stachyose/melibiose transport system substrate-binding protein
MRKPAVVVAATLLSVTLAGCFGGTTGAEQSAPPQQSSGPVEIRFMIGQPEDAADLKLMREDIKNFEAQNAGITVKLDVIPSENVRTILQTQLRSGKGPDVFGYDTGPGSPAPWPRPGCCTT